MIKRELDQTVKITEGGRDLRISKREAIIKQFVRQSNSISIARSDSATAIADTLSIGAEVMNDIESR